MKAAFVNIQISDPWEFAEALKWQKLNGCLLKIEGDMHGGKGLIELRDAINYANMVFRHIIAQPRHEGDNLDSISDGHKIFCSFTAITDEQSKSESPLDLSRWRGGVAFIGDIQLVKPNIPH